MKVSSIFSRIGRLLHPVLVVGGAFVLTLGCFLVLPFMQAITRPPVADLVLQTVDAVETPPPPPPVEEEEPEKEPEPEPPPPDLMEEAPPLDLAQLELALNPGTGGEGWLGGDFATKLNSVAARQEDVDDVFSMAELDQKPRVVYQPGPAMSKELRKKAPATVYIVFVVNQRGTVENPVIQKSTNPAFDPAALATVKKWKFEPGKRNGQTVKFRMRVPITFPKG